MSNNYAIMFFLDSSLLSRIQAASGGRQDFYVAYLEDFEWETADEKGVQAVD